jgi:hypothetical protein
MQGSQQAQKSRRADWLMRLFAKPDLEKTVWQAARDIHIHTRDTEHACSSSRPPDGLRSDLPYAYHEYETFHALSVHHALIIMYRIGVVQGFHLTKTVERVRPTSGGDEDFLQSSSEWQQEEQQALLSLRGSDAKGLL